MDKNEESAFHLNAILKDPINVSSLFVQLIFFLYYSSALFSGLPFYALSDEPMSYESDVLLMETISSFNSRNKTEHFLLQNSSANIPETKAKLKRYSFGKL